MITLTAEARAIIAEADRLKKEARKPAKLADKLDRRERRKALAESTAPNKRDPRQHDAGFLSWLHVDLPCIGCLIEGPGPVGYGAIEAAHQKLSIDAKGWKKAGLGPRTHDARCVALCSWHHTVAANACDKGQRQFWDRLGIGDGVADLCAELFHAYRTHDDGVVVVRAWAAAGVSGRAKKPGEGPSDWVRADLKSDEATQ
jgi:hypothetical protein